MDPAKIYGRFAHAGQAGRHNHRTLSYGQYCLPRGLLTEGPRQRTGLDFDAGPPDADSCPAAQGIGFKSVLNVVYPLSEGSASVKTRGKPQQV